MLVLVAPRRAPAAVIDVVRPVDGMRAERLGLAVELAQRHPQYRWETNVGYGTPEHHAGLAAHGITAHHRRSFSPVQLALALTVAPADEAPQLAEALQDVLAPEQTS